MSDPNLPEESRQPPVGLPLVDSESEVFEPAGISMRPYFSDYHLRAAAFFARQSADMEREHVGKTWGELGGAVFYEHRACVMGAILSSVAFLEATVNELFVDAVEHQAKDPEPAPTDPPRPVDQLTPAGSSLMAELWPFDIDRQRVLDKFKVALILNGKPAMDVSASPHQDIAALLALRNDLVHYKPQDIRAGLGPDEETEKLSQRLRDKGFALNPLFPKTSGNPYYPDKYLGHGCAEWAVKKSVEFADDFFSRMGVVPRYDSSRPLDTGDTGA